MADGIKGFPRLIRATRVSYWGLASAWRTEEAFRTEACLCVLLIPAALWFGPSGIGRSVMLMSLFAVLITELLNTRSEEHTSELQSLMRTSSAVICLRKKKLT